MRDVLTFETNAAHHAAASRKQAENGANQDGFAGAGLSDDGQHTARGHGKIDIVQEWPSTAVELDAKARDLED